MLPWRVNRWLERARERATDRVIGMVTRPVPLPESVARARVVLLGASVTRAWRLHLVFPNLHGLTCYEFDKTPILERALQLRPALVIIKECAAYFPGAGVRRELVRGWLERIRAAGVRPVLATVVPVTLTHAVAHPGRAAALWRFNDWVRELCAKERVPLLDLEAALRVSAADRHLDGRLHSGDGLHLSYRTYRQHLDPLIPPLLLRALVD